jgi:hypothetical protein
MDQATEIAFIQTETGGGVEGRRRVAAEAAAFGKRPGSDGLATSPAGVGGVGGYERIEASRAHGRPGEPIQGALTHTALIGKKDGKNRARQAGDPFGRKTFRGK